jgi:DNA-binding response OmpR family regulator
MKTVLYVEDDEHDVFFLKRAFTNQAPDIRVQTVHSIEEAINYLGGSGAYSDRAKFPTPDLIVSDLAIPGGSGQQLLTWVRQHSELSRLPFILLSGSTHPASTEKLAASSADCCVEKSVDFKELLAKVRKLLAG